MTTRKPITADMPRWPRGRWPRPSPLERLQAGVSKNVGGCWLWTRGRSDGYGIFWVEGRNVRVHCWAYEHFVGPIPEGLQLDHLCRNRACCNPDHLEPVTCRENLLRGNGFAGTNSRKTHCPHGHEYTPENTRVRVKGRECWTCHRARSNKRKRTRR